MTEQILQHWDLDGCEITPLAVREKTGTWDIGGKYVLKKYANADELAKSVRVSELLTARSIAVAGVVPTKDGQSASPDGLYCLMTKLPGKHASFYKEPSLAAVMGRELARLHMVLADIEPQVTFYDCNQLEQWHGKIKPSLTDVPLELVQSVEDRFSEVFPKLPRQLIHRDVHLFNVLFEDGRLTGWLDFDISQRNVRIFDAAYLLAGLLIGNIHEPEKVNKWHEIYRGFLRGYSEVNPLTDDERGAVPVVMVVIEFLFVWFWGTQGNAKQRDSAKELALWLYEKVGI